MSIKSSTVICLYLICILAMSSQLSDRMHNQISITSFNANGFCSSKPYINHLIETFDIVGVTEHWLSGPELGKLDTFTGNDVTSKCHDNLIDNPPERGRGYGGVAIYWKDNIVAYPIDIPCDRLIGIRVKQDLKDLCVVNVYLPDKGNIKESAYVFECIEKLLIRYRDNCDIIIIGDYNLQFCKLYGERGRIDTEMSVEAYKLCDIMYNECYQLICYDMSEKGSGPTYSYCRSNHKTWINHVFGSVEIYDRVLSCGILFEHNLNVSDHLPVYIVIKTNKKELTRNVIENVPLNKINWSKCNSDEIIAYTELCEQTFIHYDVESEGVNIDHCVNFILSKLKLTGQKTRRKYNHNARGKPYWGKELSDLVKAKKVSYKKWVQAGKPTDPENIVYINHKESKKTFRSKLRQCEAKYRAEIDHTIDTNRDLDQKQFWYLLKQNVKRKKYGNILRDKNGTIVSDSYSIHKIWETHFKELATPGNNKDFDEKFKNKVEEELKHFFNSIEEMSVNVLAEPIAMEEVKSGVKSLSRVNHKILRVSHMKTLSMEVISCIVPFHHCSIGSSKKNPFQMYLKKELL